MIDAGRGFSVRDPLLPVQIRGVSVFVPSCDVLVLPLAETLSVELSLTPFDEVSCKKSKESWSGVAN